MTNDLAIRIITGDVLGTSEQTQEAIIMAVKALSLPSANQWIKCSDRLPPKGEKVLVWAFESVYCALRKEFYPSQPCWLVSEDMLLVDKDFNEVKAWMPLPQYSEEE